MSQARRLSTPVVCLLIGAVLGIAAFCVGVDPASPIRSGVCVLLAIAACVYLLTAFLGSEVWRNRLIGLWPGL